jgi:hypothetical protein
MSLPRSIASTSTLRRSRSPIAGLALGLWLLALQSGCGDADAGPQADAGTPLTAEAFPATLVRAECEQLERCCVQAGYAAATQDCTDAPDPSLLQAFTGPAERFDAHAAASCLRELAQGECPRQKHARLSRPQACNEAYLPGGAARGEACERTSDCRAVAGEVSYCAADWTEGGTSRRCVRSLEVGEGEACTDPDPLVQRRCALGLLCDDSAHCVRPARLGDTCLTGPIWGDTCAAGSVCDRTDTRTCVAAVAQGEACAVPEDCEGLLCSDGVCGPPVAASFGSQCVR